MKNYYLESELKALSLKIDLNDCKGPKNYIFKINNKMLNKIDFCTIPLMYEEINNIKVIKANRDKLSSMLDNFGNGTDLCLMDMSTLRKKLKAKTCLGWVSL